MKRNLFFISVALVVFAVAGCSKINEQPAVQENPQILKSASLQPVYDMVPNEMLVKFKPGLNDNQKAAVLDKIGGKVKEKVLTKAMEHAGDKEGISLISMPLAALEAISKVKGLPEIDFAEPNYIYTHDATSNDPYFINGSLWGMATSNQYGSQAAAAWAAGYTGSSTVYVGIWSTVPVSSKGKIISGYASYSGTSMATPHVTGACALYSSTHSGSTAAQIKTAILSAVTATSSLAGKTVTGGRLNVSGF